MDAEVFRDLRERDFWVTVQRDAYDVVSELLGIFCGHDDHPSRPAETSHVECHLNVQQAHACSMDRQTQISPVQEIVTAPKRAVIYLRVSTARQASKGDSAEGYSIPQQREYCYRKAQELGAEVVEEFVDRGASARSANRPELQRMLGWLKDSKATEGLGADFVIVHKIDRLARNRADDVEIIAAIKQGGADLVSVSEQIDDTPGGKLMHGIMASLAEYYSANLSTEAKKGMAQKAKNGGTHGVAPIGYLNSVKRIAGRDVKTVVIDEDRAHHVIWAYEAYMTGEWSISRLTAELKVRGLRGRETARYRSKALSESQVHRLLKNPYYRGQILYQGQLLEGAHTPLVPDGVWFKVQDLLAERRLRGDRSWRHTHHLKGLLTCGRCGSRMGYGPSNGRGGQYYYFFCLGRHTKRTTCDLPYIEQGRLEAHVLHIIETQVSISGQQVEAGGARARQLLDEELTGTADKAAQATRRLKKLERDKQKLIDAYMAEAIAAEDLKPRQEAISREMAALRAQEAEHGADAAKLHQRLDEVIAMAHDAAQLYRVAPENAKQHLLHALFAQLKIELRDENGEQATVSAAETTPTGTATLTPVAEAVLAVVRDGVGQTGSGQQETPDKLSLVGGSNVAYLAEREGFEPSKACALPLFESGQFNHSCTSPADCIIAKSLCFNRLRAL